MVRVNHLLWIVVAVVLGTVGQAADVPNAGKDWPQFRGPNRDGVSKETGILSSWPEGGPKVLWRTELGQGYSGISVARGRLFTMFGVGSDEFVGCFDAATGEQLWRVRADKTWKDRFGDGPRSTPTVDGDVVYALSARGTLLALGVKDGATLWTRDLREDFDAHPPQWGVSTSPHVEGRLLLVNVGGGKGSSVVAFHKKSGEEVWRSQDRKAGYSTPVAVTIGGVRQVLFFTGTALLSLLPEDGSLHWEQAWKTSYDVNASTPIFIPPDKIFISTGYDVGAALLRVKTEGERATVETVWKDRVMRNKFSSSVYVDGHLYGFDESTLKCIDAETGEMKWRARGYGHGSLTYADGHLVVLGDLGALALVEATPEEYREKGRFKVFKDKTWTVPTLAGGKLYLRDQKELVSLDISG